MCVVCLRKKKDTVLYPCGHYQLCSSCVVDITGSGSAAVTELESDWDSRISKCPTCNTVIENYIKVYE